MFLEDPVANKLVAITFFTSQLMSGTKIIIPAFKPDISGTVLLRDKLPLGISKC